MDPERWRQIKRIYHSAIGLEPGRRMEFLRKACSDDESLLGEVATLLAQEGKSGDLFESPAFGAVAWELAQDNAHTPEEDLAGRALLHYRIGKMIGKGGMGEVYRALDTKLGRDVALKILPFELGQDADRMARFKREAQVLALLDHPNITSIYSIEESGDLHALVMQLAEAKPGTLTGFYWLAR